MASSVLDASALLAYINGEPGADVVASLMTDAVISAVNFAEVVTKLVDRSGSLETALAALEIAAPDVVDFDRSLAERAGGLVTVTKSKGLSLGDRACLALAAREAAPAVTADRNWMELEAGANVRVIR